MKEDILGEFIGKRISDIFAVFFRGVDGSLSSPLAICVLDSCNVIRGINATSLGTLSTVDPFSFIYFDSELGYTFISPIQVGIGDVVDSSELIVSANYCNKNESVILNTNSGYSLKIFANEDEIRIKFAL